MITEASKEEMKERLVFPPGQPKSSSRYKRTCYAIIAAILSAWATIVAWMLSQ